MWRGELNSLSRPETFARINISIKREVLKELDSFIDYKIKEAQSRKEIKKLTRSGVISSAIKEYINNNK